MDRAGKVTDAPEGDLLPLLDPTRIPTHVAIIMDGNGRWARERGLPRVAGHRAGKEAIRQTLEGCRDCGVKILTLFAFSTENWRRPPDEVEALMELLREALREEVDTLVRNKIGFKVSGDLDAMPPEIQEELRRAVDLTRENKELILNLALNYGGRRDIVLAAKRIAREVQANRLSWEAIDEDLFRDYLCTAGLPDPDLLIRTGGEIRLSNFLLWQIAYTELYFCDVYWPDFRKHHLFQAIYEYQRRQRRFGGLGVHLQGS
jgi:undecaprenyl diphosphate synthase